MTNVYVGLFFRAVRGVTRFNGLGFSRIIQDWIMPTPFEGKKESRRLADVLIVMAVDSLEYLWRT